MKRILSVLTSLLLVFSISAHAGKKSTKKVKEPEPAKIEASVTFVELGSVNCIPCKAMQPVMKEIEEKYGDQIKIIFYDVWKDENKVYAEKYKIRAIPTQVFLDSTGKEFSRHEGFYSVENISKLLEKQGLKESKTSVKTSGTLEKMKSGEVCK